MHDPMVVAFEVPSLVPRRDRWHEKRHPKRWGFDIQRRTKAENLGERVYPWWRLHGRTLRFAGRAYRMRTAITVWHVEPGGHDAFDICKHGSRWKLHVWHWHLQFHYEQRLRRFLLERCERCGRRYPWGYAPVSHQWDSPRTRWRDGVVKRAYHHECSSLVTRERNADEDAATIRQLFAMARVWADASEEEMIRRLYAIPDTELSFHRRSRLLNTLGWKYDTEASMSGPYTLTHEDGRTLCPFGVDA